MKKKLVLLSKLLIVLIIPIALVSVNVVTLFTPYYVRYEYSKKNFPDSERFTKEERLKISEQVIGYLKNTTSLSKLEETGLFNERESKHISDVRILVDKLFLIQKISVILLVYSILFTILLDKNKWDVIRYVLFGAIFTISIGLFLFAMVYLDFNPFFIKFHEILFPQGYWSFDTQDTLIQLYPKKFWVDSGVILLTLVLAEALILSLASYVLMRRLKKRENSNICIVK